MERTNKLLQKYFNKSIIGGAVSINDVRDKEFNGEQLTEKEKLALLNYDHHRVTELNRQKTDEDFHNKYIQLQVMANLSPYDEFLKEAYTRNKD